MRSVASCFPVPLEQQHQRIHQTSGSIFDVINCAEPDKPVGLKTKPLSGLQALLQISQEEIDERVAGAIDRLDDIHFVDDGWTQADANQA